MKKNMALMALTGILTLASCGGNTPTDNSGTQVVDRTLTVNLTGGVTSAPITVTDTNGVTSSFTVNNGQVLTLKNKKYTVTGGTVNGYTSPNSQTADLTNGNGSVTLNYTASNPGTNPNPNPNPSAVLNITSPTNGASVTMNQAIQVTFTTSAALTGVTCTIADGTAVNASSSTSGGFCTVTPTVAGSNVITVSGKDANGNTVSSSVAVDAKAPATPATSNISFDPTQELTLTNEGIVIDAVNGWRRIGQGVSTPGNPDTNVDVYVKGTVNVSYTAAAGSKVEIILARTTGSDVPTNDDIQAGDVLRAVASANGPVTAQLDTRRLGEFEAVREWLVFRVNGTAVSFQPVIADNKGPQQADPEFNGVSNGYSALRRNYNGTNINFARGDINLFTSNPSLQDREYGQAPYGASFLQRRPAGFESIRYYLVPETAFNDNGLQDSDEMRRAQAIKSVATVKSAAILEPGSDRSTAFSSMIGSGSQTTVGTAQRALDNVNYRIYTIVRDQLGNETASASYETIRFDNVGPVITGSALRDTSALPFPSLEPERCLSDIATVNLGGATDNEGGIGVIGQPTFNIGGINLTNGEAFDTNRLADGQYKIDYGTLTDALGNPATGAVNNTVFIDNTDPTVNFNRPALQSVVNSGERVSVESSASDGGCGVYEARLFWDTNISTNGAPGAIDDGTTDTIGHPVQFARRTADAGSSSMSLNQGWNALQVPGEGGIVQLRAMVTDRAGNATIVSTPIVIVPKTGKIDNGAGVISTVTINNARPTLGLSDGYLRNTSAVFGNTSNTIAGLGANGTVLVVNTTGNSTLDNNLTLDATGTFTTNGFPNQPLPSPTPNLVEKINAVMAYGRFDAAQWAAIRDYQRAGDPTLTSPNATNSGLANQRVTNWSIRSPWVALGDSATADNKQQYTFTSNLLNDFYNNRGFPNTGNDDAVLSTDAVSYDQFNGIVTDTAGSYSFFGEEADTTATP
ncbi:hexagonally packed intermediate-layer surface protein [Deinococcus phoenicis]|uniref:Hexagonally packed intermediate-layer surface protein n=1 Tax=Deinococcus phoenicis TaxID=1476583 RepID=A0A016QR03_9DEIO|nr:Ig-like domain-containing protein [Deinococcus phoenicis]EYB68431.1 hexagonally packed intermediate-layer surface protein [Deinococcus phoenicis]